MILKNGKSVNLFKFLMTREKFVLKFHTNISMKFATNICVRYNLWKSNYLKKFIIVSFLQKV